MKKFLYLCLFGTALAGGVSVSFAGMWDNARAGSADRPTGYNPASIGREASSAAKSAASASQSESVRLPNDMIGNFFGQHSPKPGSVPYEGVEGAFYGTTHTNSSASWSTDILNGDGVKIGSVKTYYSNGQQINSVSLNDVGKKAGYTINGGKLTSPASTGSIANATDATRPIGAQQGNMVWNGKSWEPYSPVSNPTAATSTLDSYVETGLDEENIFRAQFGDGGTKDVFPFKDGDVVLQTDTHGAIFAKGGQLVDGQGNTYTIKDGTINVEGTDYELPMQNSNVSPRTTPASGANTPTPDAGFDAEAVYGKYNKDMMDSLESQWNGTLPKVLPTGALDTGFMREAGINSFIENANGTVDLKMGSDWFGSSLTMDTKDFNAIFGKGGELPIQETHIGGGQSVLSLPNGSVLKEAQNGLLTDGKGNFFLESGGNAYPVDPNMSPAELQTVANQAKAKEALKAALVPSGIDKANVTNAFEYALQILEAVEGINQDDATKETTVKGVQSLQNSQGGASDYSMGTDVSLEATTISSAAELMVELLKNNPMNLTYMDETKCAEYKEDTSTRRECLQEMKKISANATALSGVMIAEGSNAISSKFYDRIKNFTDINNNLGTGSLGAMSVINDAERYPYFEMVRGTALSAVQLGVKEMGTLTELDDLAKEAENAQ